MNDQTIPTEESHADLINGFALILFLIACGALTVPFGAILARIILHERIFNLTVTATILTAIPWLFAAGLVRLFGAWEHWAERRRAKRTHAEDHDRIDEQGNPHPPVPQERPGRMG
ncbi:hypothetical protein [Bifidobacterium sp. SO1]|uniref:hypothetical protein n=1 Tax=Bifidobacterium sp. SO1 TaxID=2809029 RepID=UPI001BDD5A4A|nr:hypothetical protein [Bifidobacterium sp. SO1]MBT1161729.1 hypothetical protein [Bifidobacterium sp. SO1]